MKLFPKDLPLHPLSNSGLSRADELLWFRRLRRARRKQKEQPRSQLWKNRAEHCRAFLVEANQGLVYGLIKDFSSTDFNGRIRDDYESYGMEGLDRAVDSFRLNSGTVFSTWATPIIRNSLILALHKNSQRKNTMEQATDYALAALPDREEHIPDPELLRQLVEAMDTAELLEVQRTVLAFRYGLFGEKEHTLEQAGRKIGVSKERIRQIQNEALAKLRAVLEADL